jgi:hypothetical protein
MILAERRTAKVKGRMTILTVSITTIKNINLFGHPKGTRWLNIELILLITPQKIKDNHNVNPRDKDILICLGAANT